MGFRLSAGCYTSLPARTKSAMAIPRALLFACAASSVASLKLNTSIPVTQTVTIDGVEFYSQSSGHASLGKCEHFSSLAVSDEARPSITVCGTQTKVTVFLRNRCESYHTYTEEIGQCDTTAASETCVTASPQTVSWMLTAQS